MTGPPEKAEGQTRHPGPAFAVRISTNTNNPHPTVLCRRCRRPLRAVISVARCRGAVCWRHFRAEAVAA